MKTDRGALGTYAGTFTLSIGLAGVTSAERFPHDECQMLRLCVPADIRPSTLSPPWAPMMCPGLQDFFTRELKPGARPVDSPEEGSVTSWLDHARYGDVNCAMLTLQE